MRMSRGDPTVPAFRIRTVPLVLMGLIVGFGPAPAAEGARGQSTLAGSVRDVSGGVMPAVKVAATSPALIEKSRTTRTDENGRYRFEDLPPGTYDISFSLAGWQTQERQGIQVTSSL